jgi:hypothetical protein
MLLQNVMEGGAGEDYGYRLTPSIIGRVGPSNLLERLEFFLSSS